MTAQHQLPVLPELFACERLSARLTVKYCGSRFLRVRAATVGSADYDSACDRCPVGDHHARTGTLCPDTHAQTPTTTTKEKTTMGAQSDYTDDQKRDAVKQVLLDGKKLGEVAKALGFTDTTLRNWVKRFGHEVAGDVMDAAAGKPPKAKVAKATKLERAAKAIAEPKQKRVPAAKAAAEPTATPAETGSEADAEFPMTVLDCPQAEAGRLGSELGAAVRFIADKRARAAVADVAWLLTQAAHG